MRISFQHHIFTHALLRRLSLVLVFIRVAVTAASANATYMVSIQPCLLRVFPRLAPQQKKV